MKTYDVIIVLATQPDLDTWEFPQQILNCLDKAKELLDGRVAPYIATSGKWSITIDNIGLKQPFKEADEEAKILINKGVPKDKILIENTSMDTPSNLYYLKEQFLIPRDMKKLLFVVAEFRIPRLKFLCQRILGSDYTFDFEPIPSEVGPSYNEPKTWKVHREFLKGMKDGDHHWLDGKFFTDQMYIDVVARDRVKYADVIKKHHIKFD